MIQELVHTPEVHYAHREAWGPVVPGCACDDTTCSLTTSASCKEVQLNTASSVALYKWNKLILNGSILRQGIDEEELYQRWYLVN
jgi:hypothetical protein